ncbi:hypothetical protein AGABI1DRAFT_112125 [Agaricus bisporus var. burnettii JB137-S8]|uniref:Uncharacterized protein n=1 Tax=Agaricus bisporus var. burnettii (strain JB137-S8 / ATCC MYA-4627 / FGSC 10392) TaxID=597362 RepID=K5W547_AGABU|nr:uncharacterized protein AGABI1DRAFT_112125 [Agaricus bisporus var. burnettii JB137-S8]EKM81934.1 hypothetical protein AGABI1DRAFT_112125 [Agaricus bisporus var. burnettii JB137-S8]
MSANDYYGKNEQQAQQPPQGGYYPPPQRSSSWTRLLPSATPSKLPAGRLLPGASARASAAGVWSSSARIRSSAWWTPNCLRARTEGLRIGSCKWWMHGLLGCFVRVLLCRRNLRLYFLRELHDLRLAACICSRCLVYDPTLFGCVISDFFMPQINYGAA